MRLSISNVTLHVDRFDCCARFSYARYAALELTTCWYIALFSLLKHGGFSIRAKGILQKSFETRVFITGSVCLKPQQIKSPWKIAK